MSMSSNDSVEFTKGTITEHKLNAVLHNLIVAQLEYILEEPHTIMRTPVEAQTIRNALSLIHETEGIAYVSTFHFHEHENKLSLAWHYRESVVSVEVGDEYPMLLNGFAVTFIQQPETPFYSGHTPSYQVKTHQRFSHITGIELRYLLTHWHA